MIVWPFLHFFSFLSYSYLTIFILIKNPKSLLNKVVSAFVACHALWSLGKIFCHNPQITEKTLWLFHNVSSLGWTGFASFALLFSLIFAQKEKILERKLFYPLLFGIPSLFMYKQLTRSLIAGFEKQAYGWRYIWSDSIWVFLFFLYVLSSIGISLYLIFVVKKKTQNPYERKLARILFICGISSLIIASLFSVVFPELNLHAIPDIGDVAGLIFVSGIAYTAVKYNYLTISPTEAVDNIVSTMGEALILLDNQGKIVTINRAAEVLFGYQKEAVEGRSVEIFFNEDESKNVDFARVFKSKDIRNYNLVLTSKKGEKIPVVFSSSVLKRKRYVVGSVCVIKENRTLGKTEKEPEKFGHSPGDLEGDRTKGLEPAYEQLVQELAKHKRMKEQIQESEEKFRKIFEDALDSMVFLSPAGKILDVNKKALETVGLTRQEVVGKHFTKLKIFSPKEIPKITKAFARGLLGGPRTMEISISSKDGRRFLMESLASFVRKKGKIVGVVMISRDITERKKIEEDKQKLQAQLLEAEKMAGIGTLASGIAHEFNNLLQIMRGYAEFAHRTGNVIDMKEALEVVKKTSDRTASIIDSLLRFAKQDASDRERCDIIETMESVLVLMERQLKKWNIEVVRNYGITPSVLINREEIQQVFLNVITNARDAMLTRGGTLEICVRHVDENVEIAFIDTGCGVEKEDVKKVFEPFYTTKGAVGGSEKIHGTGLGLAVSYGIIKRHGGLIDVRSEVGTGTTFTVKLPLKRKY